MGEKYNYDSEEGLWESFKDGDELAYEFIFKHHYKLLFSYGLKLNPDKEEIKDCIQQLFTILWESRQRLGSNTSIKGYLLASLRRIVLKKIKSRHFYTHIDNMDPAFCVETSPEFKHIKDQKEADRVKFLSDLIQKLPDRQKEALYLKYYGDHSFGEIAEIMGITRRAVYKLSCKALDNLNLEIGKKKTKISSFRSLFLF